MRTCQPFMLLLLLWCPSSGCATTQPVTPEQVVAAYAHTAPERRSMWLVRPGHDQVLTVPASAPTEVQRQATWQQPGHPEVSVSRVDGAWSVTGGVLEGRAAETPAQALKIFSRAIIAMDAALLKGLIPSAERPHWDGPRLSKFLRDAQHRLAFLELVQRLAAVSPETIGPATAGEVTVGDGSGQVVLLREPDGWKVLEVKPSERFFPTLSMDPVREDGE